MRKFFRRFGLVAIAAVLLTYFLQFRYFNCDFSATWNFILTRISVFWYNTLIMFFITLFLSSIFQHPWFGIGLTWSAVSILTFINTNKMILRQTPLLPEDFQLADQVGSLTEFVDYWSIIRLILACLLILIACILLDHATHDFFLPPHHKVKHSAYWLRHQLLPRGVLILIALVGFFASTDFIRHHSGARDEDVAWLNTSFFAWNQRGNYDHNGFLIGFLYNIESFELTEPQDYSVNSISNLATNYEKKASSANSSLSSLSSQDYNIILVLNESFYDPNLIRDYYPYEGEVTPTWRSIIQKYPSGYTYSPEYGGGTANVEFEALTGLSNYLDHNTPYTDILPKLGSVPSIATYAKENGYQTTAVHPYNGGMYKRNFSLKTEGFDEFITESEMSYTDTEPGSTYINDWSAYRQVLDLINNRSQKQMISLITMQNHTPFNSDYPEKKFQVDANDRETVEAYLEILHRSDTYLGNFLKELDQSNEKTVVLFFGDHAPGIFNGIFMSPDKNLSTLAHYTPYFIYSNFDLPNAKSATSVKNTESEYFYDPYTDEYLLDLEPSKEQNITSNLSMNLPTTTPNCFVNTLYDYLSVKKPSQYYLIDQVCQEYPILASSYFGDNVPDKTSGILYDYTLLNYDFLSGNQYYLKPKN